MHAHSKRRDFGRTHGQRVVRPRCRRRITVGKPRQPPPRDHLYSPTAIRQESPASLRRQRTPDDHLQAQEHPCMRIAFHAQNMHSFLYNEDRWPSCTSCSLICFTVRTARSQILFAWAGVQTAGGASIKQSPPPSILSAGMPSVEIPFSRASACIRWAMRGANFSCPGHSTSIAQKTPAPRMSTTNPPSPPFSSSSERLPSQLRAQAVCARRLTNECRSAPQACRSCSRTHSPPGTFAPRERPRTRCQRRCT